MGLFSKLVPCPHGAKSAEHCMRCAMEAFDDPDLAAQLYVQMGEDDLKTLVRALPVSICTQLRAYKEGEVTVAGGYVQGILCNDEVKDIDIFCKSEKLAKSFVQELGYSWEERGRNGLITMVPEDEDNVESPIDIEIIHHYGSEPFQLLQDFDMRLCKGAFWYSLDEKKWKGLHHVDFFRDNASRKLVFETNHVEGPRDLWRILKFVGRGYHMDAESLAWAVTSSISSMAALKGNNFIAVRAEMEEALKKDQYRSAGDWEELSKPKPPKKAKVKKKKVEQVYYGSGS